MKESSQNKVSSLDTSDFDFENVGPNLSNNSEFTASQSVSKRPRSSPQEDRRTRQKSICDIDLC